MKRQILKTILIMVLGLIISGGSEAGAQSIEADNPTMINSRVITGRVSGEGTHYYSLKARRGAAVSIKATITLADGGSFSLDFRGFPGRDGGATVCCEGDSYLPFDFGSKITKELRTSFTVKTDQSFLMLFNFNTRRMDYKIEFDGIETDDAGDDLRTIVVPGTSGKNWIDTGIRVQKGDIVLLNASGRVDVNAGWGIHGPEGTGKFFNAAVYPVNSRQRYGLAARIVDDRGRTSQKWVYSDAREMGVSKTGTLWLTVNDDAPDDNTGEFRVIVSIRAARLP